MKAIVHTVAGEILGGWFTVYKAHRGKSRGRWLVQVAHRDGI